MPKLTPCVGTLAIIWLLAMPVNAATERYNIVTGGDSEVVFDSHAPLEKFQGKTDQVFGWLEVDLNDLSQPVRMEVEVDLASFDTGKGKRNKHMRENHLETDKFPKAVFSGGTLSKLTGKQLLPEEPVEFDLKGTLSLHGVEREMVCHVILRRESAEQLKIVAKFEVLLPDYEIKRPKFLIVKLAVDQKVTVTLTMQKES